MDGINVLISILILLIITLIGLIKAQSMLSVLGCFFLLTLIAHMTIYMLKAE